MSAAQASLHPSVLWPGAAAGERLSVDGAAIGSEGLDGAVLCSLSREERTGLAQSFMIVITTTTTTIIIIGVDGARAVAAAAGPRGGGRRALV